MDVLRFVLPHLAAGCLGGLTAAGVIIATNLGSLRDLIEHAQDGWLGGALLAFGFAVTFGAAAIGRAIDQIAQERD
jgi:hypothetical protein